MFNVNLYTEWNRIHLGFDEVKFTVTVESRTLHYAAKSVGICSGWDASSYREAILHGLMPVTGRQRLNCYNLHFNLIKKLLSNVLCFVIIITQILQNNGKHIISSCYSRMSSAFLLRCVYQFC